MLLLKAHFLYVYSTKFSRMWNLIDLGANLITKQSAYGITFET